MKDSRDAGQSKVCNNGSPSECGFWAQAVPKGSCLNRWDLHYLGSAFPNCVANCSEKPNGYNVLSVRGHLSELALCWQHCKEIVEYNDQNNLRSWGADKTKARAIPKSNIYQSEQPPAEGACGSVSQNLDPSPRKKLKPTAPPPGQKRSVSFSLASPQGQIGGKAPPQTDSPRKAPQETLKCKGSPEKQEREELAKIRERIDKVILQGPTGRRSVQRKQELMEMSNAYLLGKASGIHETAFKIQAAMGTATEEAAAKSMMATYSWQHYRVRKIAEELVVRGQTQALDSGTLKLLDRLALWLEEAEEELTAAITESRARAYSHCGPFVTAEGPKFGQQQYRGSGSG